MTTTPTEANWFAASWFGQFMVSAAGRLVRIRARVAFIATSLLAVGGTAGIVIAAIGVASRGLVPRSITLDGRSSRCTVRGATA